MNSIDGVLPEDSESRAGFDGVSGRLPSAVLAQNGAVQRRTELLDAASAERPSSSLSGVPSGISDIDEAPVRPVPRPHGEAAWITATSTGAPSGFTGRRVVVPQGRFEWALRKLRDIGRDDVAALKRSRLAGMSTRREAKARRAAARHKRRMLRRES